MSIPRSPRFGFAFILAFAASAAAISPASPDAAWPAIIGRLHDPGWNWHARDMQLRIAKWTDGETAQWDECAPQYFETRTDSLGYFFVPAGRVGFARSGLCLKDQYTSKWHFRLGIPPQPPVSGDTLRLSCITHTGRTVCEFVDRATLGR